MAVQAMPGYNAVAVNSGGRRAPQFEVPRQPRFMHELVVVSLKDKMVVEGADQLHVFEGRAVQGVLPRLLPLMDGTRSLKDLENALSDVPTEEIVEIVSSLFQLRLIEDYATSSLPSSLPNPETLAFLRRYCGVTGVNRGGLDAWQKLRNSEVKILDSGLAAPEAELLKSLLLASGIAHVEVVSWESLISWRPASSRRSVIASVCLGVEDLERQVRLDEWCSERQLSWLRAVLNLKGGWAELGPFFNSGENPCYQCFRTVHSGPHLSESGFYLPVLANVHFLISLIAVELTYLLSQIAPPFTGRDFQRYALPEWQSQSFRWFRLPGCSRCLAIGHQRRAVGFESHQPPLVDTAYVFESYVSHTSRPITYTKAQQKASRLGAQLSQQSPRFLNCTQYSLNSRIPDLDSDVLQILLKDEICSGRCLTGDDLSTILLMTAGIRGTRSSERKLQRWAPTGGNLGSVQLFVAVRCVSGLKEGLYLYQPREHSIARFERHEGALKIAEFMERVAPSIGSDLPDALVLFTSDFGRISKKYGVFGYRLIQLDAGAALSQLHLVAGSLGICSQTAARWADDLIAEQINLEPIQEQVTAVVSLSRKAHSFKCDSTSRSSASAMSKVPSSAKRVGDLNRVPLQTVFQMLYEESRIHEQDLGLSAYTVPPEISSIPRPSGPSRALPECARLSRRVTDVLSERVSVRHYTESRVRVEQLSTMLHCANYRDEKDWPEEHRAGRQLSFLALAWRMEDLAPGIYEYIGNEHSLVLLGEVPLTDAADLFVQSEFSAAPLIVWIAGNLAAACAAYGAFGHRQLLLRAGAAAHRLWMAGASLGLAGTIVAGIVPGAGRRPLALDGYRRASLVAVATGYPVKPLPLQPTQDLGAPFFRNSI